MTVREVKLWLLERAKEELERGEESYAFGLAGRHVIGHSMLYETVEDLEVSYERYVVQAMNVHEVIGKCPMCGGKGVLRRIPNAYSWVECENECIKTFPHDSNASAIAIWNTRVREE